jgi:eukaryotic-like serine/threonine-protein kinase
LSGQGVVAGGRFRLVRPIGDGGSGSVWQAHDEVLGRTVAVKMVPASPEDELYRRFHREARIIRRFSHRNIVTVLDAGEIAGDGVLFLAMELLHGSPLSNHLRAGEPLPPTEILPVLVEVCHGLEAAHEAGVIHRDIKPENIFLALEPEKGVVPKILDFGLSTAGNRTAQTRITADGQVLGTPMYMSPEQATARPDLTPAADVWAMGVILYEAVAGKLPFFGANVSLVLDAIVLGHPASLPAAVDRHTRAIVARCLQKEPARRYPDAAALRADLERAIEAILREREGAPPVDEDEATPSERDRKGALSDPVRIAAEPPITRPSRATRLALGRARSPLLAALAAAALCAIAVATVPRRHEPPAHAEPGLARLVRARVAAMAAGAAGRSP